MCGRFTLRTPTSVLIEQFHLAIAPVLAPRYNIAPTQDVPVVRAQPGRGGRELVPMHWGLVPSWSKDRSRAAGMINARAESVAEKPAFRSAFRRRRCLVIADGYYEWKQQSGGKQPYLIHRPDDQPFALAGLWETWSPTIGVGPEASADDTFSSCTIITTSSTALMRDLHDRMPVILDPRDYDTWLDPSNGEGASVQALLAPLDSDALRVDPVSTYVNNARHQGRQCVEVQRSLF